MAMNIDSLIRIKADVQGENNIRRLGNSMQGVQGKVKNLKMAVGGLSTAFKALGAALAVGAFAKSAQDALQLADAVGKLSTRTGIAANTLFGYQNAAELADVTNEQLTTGLLQLSKNMLEAAKGTETYAAAFRVLGVAVTKESGELRGADEVFEDIAKRFAALPDGATKAAVAMRLFGRSGAQLIPLLNGGSDALTKLSFGLSEEFTEKAQLFNDTMAGIGRRFREIQLQILDYFLPTFQMIGDAFADLFEGSSGDWQAFGALISAVLRGVAAAVYTTIAGIRFLSRVIGDLVAIADAALKRDFGKVGEIATRGLKDTGRQFQTDRRNLSQLLGGGLANERPDRTGYSRRLTGGEFNLDSMFGGASRGTGASRGGKEEKTPEQKAAEEYAKMIENLVAKASELNTVTIESISLTDQQVTAFDGVKDAANSYLESIGTVSEGIGNLAGTAFKGLEDVLTSLVTTGKANFLDFTRTILQATARMIIQQTILRSIMQALGAIPGGAAPTSPFGGPQVVSGGTGLDGSAYGATAFSKIIPFKPFASGGIINSPTMSLMGEAGPEAVLPLKRGPGGRLGVQSSGGVGSVVVNVDASGTSVQGNQPNANKLGQAIGAAVRAELVNQRRPGGLLS